MAAMVTLPWSGAIRSKREIGLADEPPPVAPPPCAAASLRSRPAQNARSPAPV